MRRPVSGQIVTVFEDMKIDEGNTRKLLMITPKVLQQGEIHELFITDEKDVKPGDHVKSHSILVQLEVTSGGMIKTGDKVKIGNQELGKIAGYEPCKVLRAPLTDLSHIFVSGDKKATGTELNLQLGDKVIFEPPDM